MKRVFYSFHYELDHWRVNMIRNIGSIKGSRLVSPNRWEEIERQGKAAVEAWIKKEMSRKCCTVVLVGAKTAERKWVQHEIVQSWNQGMGVLAIAIDEIKDQNGKSTTRGDNPFEKFKLGTTCFSEIASFKEPTIMNEIGSFLFGDASKDAYNWISRNLETWVEEAVDIRSKYKTTDLIQVK